ncbi:MAG: acyl carrier protein [Alphaproteobacteria bacterium]|nr:acyl carrier protein [Alphaproteobacteria bacterium]
MPFTSNAEDGAINTETKVIEIWERVIGSKGIGSHVRFIDVGGNSLNLVEILKQIKEEIGATPSPRLFFHREHSTVAAISADIDAKLLEAGAPKTAVNQ